MTRLFIRFMSTLLFDEFRRGLIVRGRVIDADTEEPIESRIIVTVQPGVALSGTVRDADGTPLARMLVHVSLRHEHGISSMLTTSTDEHGRYTLTGYLPSSEDRNVVVSISAPSRPGSESPAGLIHNDRSCHRCASLRGAESHSGLDFRITEARQVEAERG